MTTKRKAEEEFAVVDDKVFSKPKPNEWKPKIFGINKTNSTSLRTSRENVPTENLLSNSMDSTNYYDALSVKKSSSIWNNSVHTALCEGLFFPLLNADMTKITDKLIGNFWLPESVKFDNDRKDYQGLVQNQKNVLTGAMAFFAKFDSVVQKNLVLNYFDMVNLIPEAIYFMSYQMHNEAVHGITYTKQIHQTIHDMKEVTKIMVDLNDYESVKMKEKWAMDWIEDKSKSPGELILAFLGLEAVSFLAGFAIIDWFKLNYPGKFLGVTLANNYIRFDELCHAEFAKLLFTKLKPEYKPSQEVAHAIFLSLLEIEKKYCEEIIKEPLPGLSAAQLYQYCQFMADYWLSECGYEKLFNVTNPLVWLKPAEIQGRINFFESHNFAYFNSGETPDTLARKLNIFTE